MFRLIRGVCAVAATATLLFFAAGQAFAVPQFSPTPTALLHTLNTPADPGVSFNSNGAGDPGPNGGQIVYTNLGGGDGSLNITAGIDTMNYYDPSNGACAVNEGSNCVFNYATDLDFTIAADLVGVNVTPFGGTFFGIDIMFESTGGPDISWTDPTDGNSNMLSATWTAGTFQGNPTTGLQASLIYDTATQTIIQGIDVVGFATINSGLYQDMFGTDQVMLNLSQFFDFSPSFASITAAVIGTGEIPDFTAEIQGQIFRTASGEFVPEPGTALLVGLGLMGLGLRRRS